MSRPARFQEQQRREDAFASEIMFGKRLPPCGVIVQLGNITVGCTCQACRAWYEACQNWPSQLAPPLPPPANARLVWRDAEITEYIAQLARSTGMSIPEIEDPLAAYQQFRRQLDSLELFRQRAELHLAATGTDRDPVTPRQVADVLAQIGTFVQTHPDLLDVGLAMIRAINPNAALSHWRAGLYYAAADQLRTAHRTTESRLIVWWLLGKICGVPSDSMRHLVRRLAVNLDVTLPDTPSNDHGEFAMRPETFNEISRLVGETIASAKIDPRRAPGVRNAYELKLTLHTGNVVTLPIDDTGPGPT